MYHYEKPDNLVDLFETGAAEYPKSDLLGTKNAEGSYDWVTYEEVGRRVDNLRGGLAQLELEVPPYARLVNQVIIF